MFCTENFKILLLGTGFMGDFGDGFMLVLQGYCRVPFESEEEDDN